MDGKGSLEAGCGDLLNRLCRGETERYSGQVETKQVKQHTYKALTIQKRAAAREAQMKRVSDDLQNMIQGAGLMIRLTR